MLTISSLSCTPSHSLPIPFIPRARIHPLSAFTFSKENAKRALILTTIIISIATAIFSAFAKAYLTMGFSLAIGGISLYLFHIANKEKERLEKLEKDAEVF